MRFELLALSAAIVAAKVLNVGVISDTHMRTDYDATSSANKCAFVSGGSNKDTYAPLGRYTCDGPALLNDFMYTRFREVFGVPDVLLVPGDSVAHGISVSIGSDPTGAMYTKLKANLTATFKEIAKYFPDTIVLPTYGNNDSRYHDAAIDEADKNDYYSLINDLWFKQMLGNAHLEASV